MHRQATVIGGGVEPSEPLSLGGAGSPLPHPERALLLVETVAPRRGRLAHRRADAEALRTRRVTAVGTRGLDVISPRKGERVLWRQVSDPLPANPAHRPACEHAW